MKTPYVPNYSKHQIARSFNAAADTYNQASFLQQEIGKRLLERLMYIKTFPENILDVGGGTGLLAEELASIYSDATIVNLDLSEKLLNVNPSPLVFNTVGDFDSLPFQKRAFNLMIANCSLHWSVDLNATITSLKDHLDPSGLLMFATLGPDTLFELRRSWSAADNEQHIHPFLDMHNIGDILLHNSFIDPVVDKENVVFTYPNVRRLLQELKSMGAHNIHAQRSKGLTPKGAFSAMEQYYEEQFANDKGDIVATFEVIYGLAWGYRIPLKSNSQIQYIAVEDIKIL